MSNENTHALIGGRGTYPGSTIGPKVRNFLSNDDTPQLAVERVIEQPRYSCALAAQQTVLAIPGAHPIVHAGPGCSTKVSNFATMYGGHQGEGYSGGAIVSSTNSVEQEVVFGGEKKLHSTIEGALQVLEGDLFVVMSGCTADIVGDDTVNIAKDFAAQGKPVVGVETAGFKGSSYDGHERVVNAIVNQFVDNGSRPAKRPGLVNIFSIVPYQNPYWRGDLEILKRLLESIGLTPQVFYGYGAAGAAEWKAMPEASLNLLVSPWVGLSTVKLLEKKYSTPYLHYPVLPVGAEETGVFLRTVGMAAGVDPAVVEAVIKREDERFYQYLASLVDFLAEYRNNLPGELYAVADSAYALGLSSFLVRELGFEPKGIYITDGATGEHADLIRKTAAKRSPELAASLVFETDGGQIQRDIRKRLGNSHRALVLGSSWEKWLAAETGNTYAFVSLPLPETVIVSNSFIAWDGGLKLIEEIYSNVFKTKTTTARTQSVFEDAVCA
jgi:nitrogenase molybdenum-iron protein beta chain